MGHAAMAGTWVCAAACSAPTSGAPSPVQRHGMITQKGPEGSDVMPGLSPSMRRRVEPMAMAFARYPGANAITGGLHSRDMVTGTWMCESVSLESLSVSVRWPGLSQVSRTEFRWLPMPPLPSSDRSHEMSAGRWVSGMVASARNSCGITCR